MKRRPVSSSSIRSVGYDPQAHTLELEYQTGAVYRYRDVPAAAHRLLLQAPSLGKFVNEQIKPRFEAERVEEA
jgi:sorbitol-specific phosphotransferase system component IIC